MVIKALEVLENSADFSVSGTVVTNCSFTSQQQPTEEPRVVWPDDKADTAAEEEEED